MKKISILVLAGIFVWSNVLAMGGVKRIKEKVENSFKEQVQIEVNKQRKDLMKEFHDVRKTVKTVQDKWESYNQAKIDLQRARENGADTSEIVARLLVVGEWAKLLNRKDILSWQYNNIGWEFIKKFNELTENGTKKVDEAEQYLLEAKKYLNSAKELEGNLETGIERKKTINNNLSYVIAKEVLFQE